MPDLWFDAVACDWAGTVTGTRHRPGAPLLQHVLKTSFATDVPQAFLDRYTERFWDFYHQSLADTLPRLLAAVASETGVRLPDEHDLATALWDACPDHDPDIAAADALRLIHQRYGVPVWLMTNTCRPPEHRQRSLRETELGFVQPLCSSAIGVAKPQRAYYAELIRRAGVPARRILAIGDHLVPDVLGPAAAGMLTVWINGATAHEAENHRVPDDTIVIPHLSRLPEVLTGVIT